MPTDLDALFASSMFSKIIGAGGEAYGALQAGAAADENGRFLRDQAFRLAKRQRGTAQRVAAEEVRRAALVEGRARAVAASSGGGVPDVQGILSGIQAEGRYRAMSALYEGEVQATGTEIEGIMARGAGRAAMHGGRVAAAGAVTRGAAAALDLYSKWRGPGSDRPPPSSAPKQTVVGAAAVQTFADKYGMGGPSVAQDPATQAVSLPAWLFPY